jgi:adenine-specific DNA-methyltransferase
MPKIDFKGKSFVQNHHLAVPFHQLIPDAAKSVSPRPSLSDNLIVNGDNLIALKALLPTYAGKIKCIYIDPPYNTGNEGWAYNDKVNSPMMKEWLDRVVGREGEDLTRHDKWLCMMMPRLKLLKELISEDGVLLISIDDNEVANLKCLLDEIFQGGHVATFVWRRRIGSSMSKDWISADHEYILAYSLNPEMVNIHGDDRDMTKFNIPDGKGRSFASMPLTVGMNKAMRPNQWYELKNPKTGTGYWPTDGRVWGYYPPTMEKKVDEGLIIFPEDYPDKKLTTPRLKTYPEDAKRDRKPTTTWLDSIARTEDGTKTLKHIFGDSPFSYSKPSELIKHLLTQFSDKDSLILDSFAGSGTTAQAVLELNKEDGGNRKFILVEMEDYADKITAERVRRVIKGIPSSKNEALKHGLGGTFSFVTLGSAIETESLLNGTHLPSYEELARYVYYTSTGEDFDPSGIDEKRHFIGKTNTHDLYMYYKPDLEYLKSTALTLDEARSLHNKTGDRSLIVFAPTKYVEQTELDNLKISFCQLPFAIYKLKV